MNEDDLRKSMSRPLTVYDLDRVMRAMRSFRPRAWTDKKHEILSAGINELERIRTEPQVGDAVNVEPPTGTSTTISPHSDNDPPRRRRRR